MGFVSFVGRVLFASVFILSAYQEYTEFGVDGGPAVHAFKPQFKRFANHVVRHTGFELPSIYVKEIVATMIGLKGLGGFLFIFSSSFGAYLLLLHLAFFSPIMYDFYNYDIEKPIFVQLFVKFAQNLALFGALLFYLGMKRSPRRAGKKSPKAKTS